MKINQNFTNINKLNTLNINKNNLLAEKQSAKDIELPNISLSQIVLPDNKIYTTSNSLGIDFNKNNLSTEIPKHYIQSQEQDTALPIMQKRFDGYNINLYKDTTNNQNVIRAQKNTFDENRVLNSIEVVEYKDNHGTRYIKDFEHNRETEISFVFDENNQMVTQSKTILHKNSANRIVKAEEYKKSPFLEGIFDITETLPNGQKKIISQTTKDENGNIRLEKNLVSLDGTKTKYIYETDSTEHNKTMFCQITNSNGEVLSTIDRTYKKEDEKVSYSTVNGHKYKAEKTEDGGVIITDYAKNEITEIKHSDFDITPETLQMVSKNKTFSINPEGDVLQSLIDSFPPDTLLTIHNNVKELIPVFKDSQSTFILYFDYLRCKPNPNQFVVNHELGHSMDAERVKDKTKTTIKEVSKNRVFTNNKNFVTAFTEEKAAFNKAFPEYEEKFLSYFLAFITPFKGRTEVVAETNAINGTNPSEPDYIAMRTIMLQTYFPRSIAELTKMMNPVYITNGENSNN